MPYDIEDHMPESDSASVKGGRVWIAPGSMDGWRAGVYGDGKWTGGEVINLEDESPVSLTGFLLARLAEDEASIDGEWADGYGLHIISTQMDKRLRAEVEAKRRIVERHQPTAVLDHLEFDCTCGFEDHRRSQCLGCGVTTYDKGEFTRTFVPCPELCILAAIYADHPDFNPDWSF